MSAGERWSRMLRESNAWRSDAHKRWVKRHVRAGTLPDHLIGMPPSTPEEARERGRRIGLTEAEVDDIVASMKTQRDWSEGQW